MNRKALVRANSPCLLPTGDDVRFNWMAESYKQERIQRTTMSFKCRLAAITASDNRKGKQW